MSFAFPSDERFSRRDAARAQLEAVEALCRQSGHELETMEQLTLAEILELAIETYGEAELPAYWSNWQDWMRPGTEQPMGDL